MSLVRSCLICGAELVEAHHPTGRDPQGVYLDPALMMPFCHDHHMLFHDDWWTADHADPAQGREATDGLSWVERVELRLRRLALLAGRLANAYPEFGWLAWLARAVKGWADELARDMDARDQRDAGWRADPVFFPPAA